MPKNLTKELFVEKSIAKHGNKFDFSTTSYKNNRTPISINCSKHGLFEMMPFVHLKSKHGCPKCANEAVALQQRKSVVEFVNQSIAIHGDAYDYTLVKYKNNKTKVKLVCKQHGAFLIQPAHHLNGTGCSKCYEDIAYLTTAKFIDKSIKIHGNKFDYSKVQYVNHNTKICITCNKCNRTFWQRPNSHLAGSGCSVCSNSKELNPAWNTDRQIVSLRKLIRNKVSKLIYNTLKYTKSRRSEFLLGYTKNDLLKHLTNHPNWKNCEGTNWHIDHVFPIIAFTKYNIVNTRIINHLSNLQPLSQIENLQKGTTFNEVDFQNWLLQFDNDQFQVDYNQMPS